MNHQSRIYLDYAASTPVDRLVFDAMKPYFGEKFGNAGSLHSFGQEAMAALDASRETIAKAIGAEFREIVFTGSATEANNLALRGTLRALRESARKDGGGLCPVCNGLRPRIIISAIEHESVLETARCLEREGVDVVYLPVHKNGVVDLDALKKSLNDRTVLVSVMYVNNEIGAIQPITEISEIIRNFRETRDRERGTGKEKNPRPIRVSCRYPLFHTDAVQAFQFLDCDAEKLGVDMMTLSAHKIYGPKGVGCLYVKQKLEAGGWNLEMGKSKIQDLRENQSKKLLVSSFQLPASIVTGGGQEFGMRSGTENIPLIVGFMKAVSLVTELRKKESVRIQELCWHLWRGIKKIAPKSEWNGRCEKNSSVVPAEAGIHPSIDKIPNILNVYFPGCEAQDILTRLDLCGVAVSSGSACRARALSPSYVIAALGHTKERAKASIRMSLGRPTTKKEIDRALMVLKNVLSM